MTLEELLQLEQSRRNIDQVTGIVKQYPEMFKTLWSIFCELKEPESRRAAWAIDILTETNPFLTEDNLETLILLLPIFKHEGYKRHSLRILERNKIPEKYNGHLVSSCFKWLESPSSSVAVKMFSLKILSQTAIQEPALRRELIDIIELQLNDATPGFKNIGLKIIKRLQSEFVLHH